MSWTSKHSKNVASRLREFTDSSQEHEETGSADSAKRKAEAMRKMSPEDYARANDILARRVTERASDDRDFLKNVAEMEGMKRKG